MKISGLILAITILLANNALACTNYLITKGASTDGSTMISYAADSHILYGELYHWPAATHPIGTMLDVYEWDTGKYLGKIEQALKTYNVVGNMNENQVAIGETTYGGRPELATQAGAIMDYGSLIYIGLQRATSARDAIKIITNLMAKYGYFSSGESFSISDKDEVWILDLIGKGEGEKGAVWVARMIPDGYVSGHANQTRIETFPQENDKSSISSNNIDQIFDTKITTVYATDVISFAREKGWYVGEDKNFSFSETYAPVDFGGARFCEIRVWTMFNKVAPGMDKYWEYVKGNIEHNDEFADGTPNPNHYATNRMPLWVKPEKKVSVHDMLNFMRDHLENTELDMSIDVGAGPFKVPYRWRPLTWKVDDVAYCNERATATQQTGFSFVTQSRNWLPDAIGGIIWWGVDDASGSVYMPMYSSITTIPYNFAVGNGSMMKWSNTSGFWIFNQVQNYAYTRYSDIHPEIEKVQTELETGFIAITPAIDAAAKELLNTDRNAAIAYLTDYSNSVGANVFNSWKNLYHYLFVKYMDGNIKTAREIPEGYKYYAPTVSQPGYGEDTYRLIIEKTGAQFKVVGGDGH
ncbi:MAG: C69 family dipeptidase [Bacteroidetes bacterium]|nr:C69 family dipeptidase [Bacteroidota bacterium]MBL6942843.1 C69 family dipeptidase [Bacteroidales bacterium]